MKKEMVLAAAVLCCVAMAAGCQKTKTAKETASATAKETTESVTEEAGTGDEEDSVEMANSRIETDAALETAAVKDELVGGWTKAESPKLTDEVKEYFAEAFPDGTSTFYEPVALLGTQVVSGTNYKILYRKISIGNADAVDTYGIGTIYVDLQKNVEVLEAGETGIPTHLDEGGWTTYDVTDLTDDEKNAFQDAFHGMTGVSYDPLAVIAESDDGYYVLCEAKVVYPGTELYYAVVEINKTETGNLKIGEITDLVAEGK